MAIDFNSAGRQQAPSDDLIPKDTVAPVIITVREALKTFRSGGAGLDLEFIITSGPYAKRRAWKMCGVESNGTPGQDKMVEISHSFLRAILESAGGVQPHDESPAACAARQIDGWDDFNGLEFVARFGIEKGKPYEDQRTGEMREGQDKNTVMAVTPDEPEYAESGFRPTPHRRASAPASSAAPRPAAASSRPNFAR